MQLKRSNRDYIRTVGPGCPSGPGGPSGPGSPVFPPSPVCPTLPGNPCEIIIQHQGYTANNTQHSTMM